MYPGVGWVLWRDAAALPQELIFNVNYLGGNMPTFALDFSRPGSEVIAQHHTSARLGRSGFTAVQQAARDSAMFLAREIEALPKFRWLSRGDVGRSPPTRCDNGFSPDLAELFLNDLRGAVEQLNNVDQVPACGGPSGFHH